MLKGIDPILTPDVLHALCAMGHGDEVVIVDSHYPADTAGKSSTYGKILRLDAADTARAIRAVLSVFELDSFVAHPAERMAVDNQPDELPNVQREAQAAVDETVGKPTPFAVVSRELFYDRAKKAYAVILTGETRGWGCFIFRKGLSVTPDSPATSNHSSVAQWGT
jgi:L-fucose mutarotase